MMRQSIDSRSAASRSNAIYLMAVALCAFVMPAAPSFAQASGEVRVKFAKAGLLAGVGLGSGVLTYQTATNEAKSAENPANFRPYRWGTGGEPLPLKQHKKAAKAHRIVR